MSSLLSVKAKNEARLLEEQRTERRRLGLLVLIHQHLINSGYLESAERLQAESGITMNKHEVADNIDLMSILQDYEDYFQIRFNKQPKFTRKKGGGDGERSSSDTKPKKPPSSASRPKTEKAEKQDTSPLASPHQSNSARAIPASTSNLPPFSLPRLTPPSTASPPLAPVVTANPFGHTTLTLNGSAAPSYSSSSGRGGREGGREPGREGARGDKEDGGEARVKVREGETSSKPMPVIKSNTTPILNHDEEPVDYDYKLLKPLPLHLTENSEFRELAAIITRDIFLENPNVKWTDIVGLENAKKLLNEAVAMPLKYPQLFTGLLTPWKGILLYGPPGTGKTMLAKAVASMSRTTFFNISAASIVSKWRGDSEKLVRVLFELARHHAPSTIFLDEIDALMSHRGGEAGGEHEASRRMKTELLIQVDGLAKSTEQVFLLAVSNLPWSLDSALLRRLEKREAREDMFRHYLPREIAPKTTYDSLAALTEGYSGSDIRLVCKESAMAPLRRLLECLERGEKQYNEELKMEPITADDIEAALKSTKSSAHRDLEKYQQWQQEFGSV